MSLPSGTSHRLSRRTFISIRTSPAGDGGATDWINLGQDQRGAGTVHHAQNGRRRFG